MAENLSGIPPAVTLSGLGAGPGGAGGLSGQPGGGIGGTAAGGMVPGMEGGMDLATLMQMLQGGGDPTAGLGVGGDINAGVGAGAFGSGGGLGAGSFGQTQPGYVAGQSSMGGQSQGQNAAAGAADPASIIQKFLGLAQQGAGLFGGAGTASPTTGATGTSDQLRSQAGSDPFSPSYAGVASAPSPGAVGGPMPTQAGDEALPTDLQVNSLGIPMGEQDMQAIDALFKAGLTGDQIKELIGSSGMESGGLEQMLAGGQGGTGGFTGGTGVASPTTAPGGGTDYLGGSLGLLQGLMNLYKGSQSGNAGSILGGAGSALAGANQLAPGMGLGDLGSGMGLVGGAANAPFAALSLANAVDQGDAGGIVQGLASLYGTTVPVINAVFGTSLPTLTSIAASALSGLGGTIGGSVGGALGSLGGALGGGAAAAGSGGAAAGASAAGAGVAAPLAMLTGPYVIAKLIQAYHAMGPDKENARELGIRVNNIYGQLPGEIQTLQGIPGIASQLTADSSPDQAADVLKQLNALQTGFQEGGWENYMKGGVTQVKSVGDESGGQGMEASFPEVQKLLMSQAGKYMPQMDLARLRAQDMLEKSGWTPEQIQAKTGRYIPAEEWAQGFGGQPYNSSEQGNLGSGGGPNSVRYNPWMQANFEGPGRAAYAQQLQEDQQMALARASNGDPYLLSGLQYGGGIWSPEARAALKGFGPGGIEQGLAGLGFGQSFGWGDRGFGQGLSPAMQQQQMDPAMLQQLMAQANSPQASTAGGFAQGQPQGLLQEETLMDLLRRMSPGAAYAGA